MTDKQTRKRRLQSFVDCFNIAYPRWEINGDADKALEPAYVEYRTLTSAWGRCGPRQNGKVYFGLNHSWWDRHDTPAQLGLLIHELAHVKHTNHRPVFWEQVVRVHNRLSTHPDETAKALNTTSIDWGAVAEWLVNDPKNNTVDNRIENAYERRLKLADALDYPTEDIEPFAGIRAYWVNYPDQQTVAVTTNQLQYESHSIEALRKWFDNPKRRTGVKMDRGNFHIDYPVAVKNGAGYKIVEGDQRVDLQKYLKRGDRIIVAVTDGSTDVTQS